MFKNYIKTAVRFIFRHKVTTAINILGLAVGIGASLVIFMIVQYDYSFDKWEPDSQNVYVVTAQSERGSFFGVPVPAPQAIKSQIAGIETVSQVIDHPATELVVTIPGRQSHKNKTLLNEKDIVFADENYFKIFPRQWLKGSPSTSLAQSNKVVLSLSVAQKYFPGMALDEVVGQRIDYDSVSALVSGIVADLTEHSDFDNKSFISLSTFSSAKQLESDFLLNNWTFPYNNCHCFIRLYKNSNIAQIRGQLKKLYASNGTAKDINFDFTGGLQPLSEMHFGITQNGKQVLGKADKTVLTNLATLALALLLLAAINFINLSTAQSSIRAMEIGVRKTLGGKNKHIIFQFLTEMFLTTFCAALFSLAISPLLLFAFKGFIPAGLGMQQILQPVTMAFLAAMVVLVTLLAGLYPAFVLTKFRPVLVLKAQVASGGKSRGAWLRQGLTVSQFVIAQVFLVVVIVVGQQINYELNKDIGLRKDAIVTFKVPGYQSHDVSKKAILINELKKMPQIQNITAYSGEPFSFGTGQMSFTYKGENQGKLVPYKSGDSNYIKVYNIPLIAGRNIKMDTSGQHSEVLVNAMMARKMGFKNPQDAVGNFISYSGDSKTHFEIVGVMKDFNTQSLHAQIEPLIFMGWDAPGGKISLALNPADPASWQTVLHNTELAFNNIYPNRDFSYTFFDEAIAKIYESDIRLSTLLRWASGLAIFISCLGLYGLVSFMANQRAKEISIRKVLGATIIQNLALLSKSLIRLVALACIIAFPIAWYFSNNWLQSFAFKVNVGWWIFLLSGIGMLLLGLTVLCARTFKVATANPVDSLRQD